MLRCGNDVYEVLMFSLIALYFEHRSAQAARAQTVKTAGTRSASPANDVSMNRVVAKAA